MCEEILIWVFIRTGVGIVETVRFLAKPGNYLFIASGLEYSGQSIKWIGGTAIGRFITWLASFVE